MLKRRRFDECSSEKIMNWNDDWEIKWSAWSNGLSDQHLLKAIIGFTEKINMMLLFSLYRSSWRQNNSVEWTRNKWALHHCQINQSLYSSFLIKHSSIVSIMNHSLSIVFVPSERESSVLFSSWAITSHLKAESTSRVQKCRNKICGYYSNRPWDFLCPQRKRENGTSAEETKIPRLGHQADNEAWDYSKYSAENTPQDLRKDS